MSKLMSEEDS